MRASQLVGVVSPLQKFGGKRQKRNWAREGQGSRFLLALEETVQCLKAEGKQPLEKEFADVVKRRGNIGEDGSREGMGSSGGMWWGEMTTTGWSTHQVKRE